MPSDNRQNGGSQEADEEDMESEEEVQEAEQERHEVMR